MIEIYKKTALFKGIEGAKLESIISCLDISEKSYSKNSLILQLGEKISGIAIIVKGSVQLAKDDAWGNRVIIASLYEGEMFGEAIAFSDAPSPVTVMASTDCIINYINSKRLLSPCQNACGPHMLLIENIFKLMAEKNIMLNSKIDIISKRSIREKLMAYFINLNSNAKGTYFFVPFSREQLADFLCINRSAMSRELAKMQKEGIIKINKRRVRLN